MTKTTETQLALLVQSVDTQNNRLTKIENKLDTVFITRTEFRGLEEKVDEHENLKNWGIRLVLGTIILAGLALLGLRA